jgi:hypothetical protein
MAKEFFDKGGPGLSAAHFIGESTLKSLRKRDGFDYVKLELIAGEYTFPTDYRGFSGGGIWLVPFTIDPDRGTSTVGHMGPFLVGVAFHQSDLNGAQRVITGHGPFSVHRCVPRFLKKLNQRRR